MHVGKVGPIRQPHGLEPITPPGPNLEHFCRSIYVQDVVCCFILRYEIFMDEVKPSDLSLNFLREFMALPLSYYSPGAPMKYRK